MNTNKYNYYKIYIRLSEDSEKTRISTDSFRININIGIGFDRTETGSKAVEQYFSPVKEKFNSLKTYPEKFYSGFIMFHGLTK